MITFSGFCGWTRVAIAFVAAFVVSAGDAMSQSAKDVFGENLPKAGLFVHLGTSDGALEQELAASGKVLVHGLATSVETRDAVRRRLTDAGFYGVASAELWPAQPRLPYASDLVNVVIATKERLDQKSIPLAEVLRILVPGGKAIIKSADRWEVTIKPWPKEIDDWTHADYDCTNNPVSHDMRVAPVTTLKWIDGYRNDGYGLGARFWSWRGTVVHEMHPVAPRSQGNDGLYYAVRDGFNGLPHYYMPVKSTSPAGMQSTVVADGKMFTMANSDDPRGPMRAYDLASGKEILRFDERGKLESPEQAGGTNHAYQGGAPRWVRIVYHKGTLYQTSNDSLYALDSSTGKQKWVYRDPAGHRLLFATVAPDLDRVFVAQTLRPEPGKFNNAWGSWGARWPGSVLDSIVSLDAASGKPQWTNRDVKGQAISQLVYDEGRIAYFSTAGILAAAGEKGSGIEGAWIGVLDARTGKLKWSRDYRNDKPFTKGQHFAGWGFNVALRQGKAYLTNQNDIVEFHADTGEPLKLFALPTLNARCTRPRLTVNYHLVGFGSFVDGDLTTSINQDISRGGCTVGPTPANGMTYLTPAACHCFAMLRGFAGYGSEPVWDPLPLDARLVPGEPGLRPQTPEAIRRHDPVETFSPRKDVEVRLQRLKGNLVRNLAINNDAFPYPETEPAKFGDLSLVAVVNEHRLEARRGDKVVWSFTADGRISAPSATLDGRVCVGSHDGWVTCLDGKDGRVLWRFLAAPNHRKIVAYGQLESSWPVYGAVVHEGRFAVSAGRHPELDGGIAFFGLNPATGKAEWSKRLDTAAAPVKGSSPQLEGKPRGWRQPANTIINGPLSVVDGKLTLVSPDRNNEGIARAPEHYSIVIDPASGNDLSLPTRQNTKTKAK